LGVDDDSVGMVARRAGVSVSLHLVVLLRSGVGGVEIPKWWPRAR
jgi:hypothetical protein